MDNIDNRLRVAVKFNTDSIWPTNLDVLCNGNTIIWPKPIYDQDGNPTSVGTLKSTWAYELEYDAPNNRYIIVSWTIWTKRSVTVDAWEIQFVNDLDIPKDYTVYMIKDLTGNAVPTALDRGRLHPLQRDVVPAWYTMTILPTEQLVLWQEITIDWTLDCWGSLIID